MKDYCTWAKENPVAFIVISKYMVNKYGVAEALKRAKTNKRVKIYRFGKSAPYIGLDSKQ